MFFLSRIVRLPLCGNPTTPSAAGNGLVSVAPATDFSPMVEFEVQCAGQVGPSGYLVDITVIDRAVRERLAGPLARAARAELGGTPIDLRALLRESAEALASALPVALAALTYRPSPFRSATMERPISTEQPTDRTPPMPDAFVLNETFEFAASHRLHLPSATPEENRALFGKCSNPNGHGHNYRIEVSVEVPPVPPVPPAPPSAPLGFEAIERIVQAEVMARFDHKHLNLDCPEFAALNPSVEHIAMVCHGLLAPRFAEAGAKLRFVRVWETDKTSCRYPG